MSADALLSIEDLSIEFDTAAGRVTALRGVSFALKRGEILGVVGESGSGKTVACRSIVRLLAPAARITAGRVLFAGRDMLTLSDRELIAVRGEKIAMIFQNPSTHLDPLMSVGRQIGEALRVHFGTSAAEARRQTIQLLRDVHITEPERRVDAYPHELSGGMRQRVMIAAALACRPDILIADEPTTALDVTVQAEILRLLERLRAERELAMIIVSHDLGVVAEVCDRVVVMKDGRVVETGAMTEVLERPREDYTRQLVGSQPALMSRWRSEAAAPDGNGGTATRPDSIALERLSVQFSRSPGLIGWMLRRSGHIVNAVDDISLAVRPGETLGIVGEERLRQEYNRACYCRPRSSERGPHCLQRTTHRSVVKGRAAGVPPRRADGIPGSLHLAGPTLLRLRGSRRTVALSSSMCRAPGGRPRP